MSFFSSHRVKKLSTYLQIFRSYLYHQFLCADEKHERAVGAAEHTVDFVDADVAAFCHLSGSQRHFQMDRNSANVIFYVKTPYD